MTMNSVDAVCFVVESVTRRVWAPIEKPVCCRSQTITNPAARLMRISHSSLIRWGLEFTARPVADAVDTHAR